MTTLFSYGLPEPECVSIAEMEEIFGRELSWEDVRLLHTGEAEAA